MIKFSNDVPLMSLYLVIPYLIYYVLSVLNVLIDEFVCLLWLTHCYLVMLLLGMQTAK